MKIKKVLALILALAMLFTLVACSDNKAGDDTKNPDSPGKSDSVSSGDPVTLVAAGRMDPGTYGPYGNSDDKKMFQDLSYEPLLFYNSNHEVEKVMLKDYESLGNGVYRLYLYDYIYDHKDNPIKSSDIVFSYEKAIENGTYASILASFDKFEIVDDHTLDMYLVNERAGSFVNVCCSIKIISQAAWESSKDGMTYDVAGTGGYILDDVVTGSYISFKRWDNHWQKDESLRATCSKANSDFVRWDMVTDNSAAAVALQTGEVQYSKTIPASDYSFFMDENYQALDGYNIATMTSNMMHGISFNCGDASVCSDVDLRKAICYAIDTEMIAQNIYGDIARAAGNYVNPAYHDYDESLENLDDYYRFNLEKAKSHLKASDYNNETIKILVSPMGRCPKIAPLVQGFLMELGINSEIMAYDNALYTSYLYDATGEAWDMVITGDRGATGAEYMWSVLYAGDSSLNDFGNLLHVDDPTLQKLYEEMSSVEGNSTASLKAYLDHVKENCYQYGIMLFDKFTFSSLETLVVNGTGDAVCGACVVKAD